MAENMMRRIACRYCGAEMVLVDQYVGRVWFRCSNGSCRSMSPTGRTEDEARRKVRSRELRVVHNGEEVRILRLKWRRRWWGGWRAEWVVDYEYLDDSEFGGQLNLPRLWEIVERRSRVQEDGWCEVDMEGGASVARPKVVCLCGSTRFEAEYEVATVLETLQGRIVLSVGGYGYQEGDEVARAIQRCPELKVKQALDLLHLAKIARADEVLALDVGGYIGESTRAEIEFAEVREIPVRLWSSKEETKERIQVCEKFRLTELREVLMRDFVQREGQG